MKYNTVGRPVQSQKGKPLRTELAEVAHADAETADGRKKQREIEAIEAYYQEVADANPVTDRPFWHYLARQFA